MGVKKSSQLAAKSKTAVEQQVQSRGPVVRRLSHQQPEDSNAASDAAPAVPREDANGIICVCPTGDVVLDVQSAQGVEKVSFRASARALTAHSTYFQRLLQDTRFAEGAAVSASLAHLRTQHANDLSQCPSSALPRVAITDLGRTSPIKSLKPIMTDFLLVLHNGELATRKLPLTNLTNLAVVADRFAATEPLAAWVRARGVLARPKANASAAQQSEESLRQRLLLGLLLPDAELVQTHSRDLILKGSPYWDDPDLAAPHEGLWWDLPRGVEEELQHRRSAILRALWSLLRACLDAYSNGARQCRLGYDSSLQCDVFQLGQFVRFLARAQYLSFASALAPDEPLPAPRDRDILALLAALRACPAYQVDANHAHCGPKKPLVAGLAVIEGLLSPADLGLCVDCWANPRNMLRSWTEGKPALAFEVARMPRAAGPRAREPIHVHTGEAEVLASNPAAGIARELFTADSLVWNTAVESVLPVRGEWSPIAKMANA